jgi:HTH-type transcriptional regulator/antitoxin HigA
MLEIKTQQEYQEILIRIEKLFEAQPNTEEGEELLRLVRLVEEYENKHYPI